LGSREDDDDENKDEFGIKRKLKREIVKKYEIV
jgi:hypothetical protein